VRADGTAHLEVSTLAAGSHGITARYEGDAAYAPHTSDALTQVVQAPDRCPRGPSGDMIRWPSMFAQACCVVFHIRSVIGT